MLHHFLHLCFLTCIFDIMVLMEQMINPLLTSFHSKRSLYTLFGHNYSSVKKVLNIKKASNPCLMNLWGGGEGPATTGLT